MTTELEKIKSLKVGQTIEIDKFIIKKTDRKTYRLGEKAGDWIMSGTAEDVLFRACVDLESKVKELAAHLIKIYNLTKYQALEMAMDIMRKAAGMQTKHS